MAYWFLGALCLVLVKKYGLEQTNPRIAYHNIPFELEAYAHDNDYTYPFNRKRFGWTKWI